jgi:uncharacterized protein
MFEWPALLAVGLVAGTLGGVIGFGTTILLMPPMVWFYGPVETVPTLAIVATTANLSRAAVWWREIDWRVCGAYSLGAVPAVALGARTLVTIPERPAEVLLGLFLLAMIPARRWLQRRQWRPTLAHMTVIGVAIGYLTGVVATTGAINTPFFLAYGLTKGAYLGTEALSSLAMYLSKGIAFQRFGILDGRIAARGLAIGVTVMCGSWFAKRLVARLQVGRFQALMEAVMLVSGLTLLGVAAAR